MPPALPVVRVQADRRNAGKTWLGSALIEELTRRGYAVGAIKHSHHAMPQDKPRSDTDRFARAGAQRVVLVATDGVVDRAAGETALTPALDRLLGEVDIAIVEGFGADDLGARLHIDGDSWRATLTSMAGREIAVESRDNVAAFADAIEREFELAVGGDEPLRRLIRRAAAFHGHACPGVTLGVRMAVAASRLLDVRLPAPHRSLDITVETARCATDAITAVTGCSLGRGNLRVDERGALAARFVETHSGCAVRVAARDEAKALAGLWAPAPMSSRHAQAIAYRVMPDELLLDIEVSKAQTCAAAGTEGGAPVVMSSVR